MSNVKIHFLGTGDAFCSGGRFQTCFHVSDENQNFLIDCGATSMAALKAQQISSSSIDHILVTHFHGDHYGGIPFFLIDAFYEEHREKLLRIAGPPGIEKQVLNSLEVLYPGIDPAGFSYPIQFLEYSTSETMQVGDLGVNSFEVIHAPESLPHALKIQIQDKILSFTGDTGWVDNLPQIAHDADLFICECNFFETEMAMHLNYQQVSRLAPTIQCKKLLLNHLGSEMLANLDKVEIACARDGMRYEL